MSSPGLSSRHASFDRPSRRSSRLQPRDDLGGLELSRTRSHDLSIAESVAVHEPFDPEAESVFDNDSTTNAQVVWPRSTKYLLLFTAFLTSTSFGITQVPLLYILRLMTCDIYYESHHEKTPGSVTKLNNTNFFSSVLTYTLEPMFRNSTTTFDQGHDRCSVHAIESATALHISLLGATTTIFGIVNLFVTGSLIKRIGLKRSLVLNVGFPVIRLIIQNIGVEVWGELGIIIIQCSQMVTILGGPSGYLLVLNSFMTEVVDYEERTAALGRVAGAMMFGSALGFLFGGLVADSYGIEAPFRVALVSFLCASLFVATCLPYVGPVEQDTRKDASASKKVKGRIEGFFGPLLVFMPKKFVTRQGLIQMEFGPFLLAWGVFLGILATGYLPTLLQLYATDVFQFGTKANGFLIFMYSLLRGAFLTFAFPKIIAVGRRLTTKHDAKDSNGTHASEQDPLLPRETNPDESNNQKVRKGEQTFAFDLLYTRFSLLGDGILTLLCSFTRQGWQMYLVAAVLPLSAGTGSAAKGTVLQMVGSSASSSERTDALAGLSLVENMARLSTTLIFSVVFAAFASIGRLELVFVCNAGVAAFGFLILLFAHFPPEGSHRLDRENEPATDD